MIAFPISKINIGLRVIAKRSDGYHDLETIFYPTGLCDALEFVPAETGTEKDILKTSGFETGAPPEKNLVIKAVNILREKHQFPFLRIHLHKAIPSGAGLGGGSSDSVCVIKAISRAYIKGIAENELKDIALSLGSDCPFFLRGIPVYATGRGEMMKPVKRLLDGYYIIILNPGVSISTKEAFENCSPSRSDVKLSDLWSRPVNEWKGLIMNDFEDFAFGKYPQIGELKNRLYDSGALFSLMSGSGSSVYGIFRKRPSLPASIKKYMIFEGRMQ